MAFHHMAVLELEVVKAAALYVEYLGTTDADGASEY
jgi:hypothetical protein